MVVLPLDPLAARAVEEPDAHDSPTLRATVLVPELRKGRGVDAVARSLVDADHGRHLPDDVRAGSKPSVSVVECHRMLVFVGLVAAFALGALIQRLDRIVGRLDRLIALGEKKRDVQERLLGEVEHHFAFGGNATDDTDDPD
jgi:hypothetical protein